MVMMNTFNPTNSGSERRASSSSRPFMRGMLMSSHVGLGYLGLPIFATQQIQRLAAVAGQVKRHVNVVFTQLALRSGAFPEFVKA